MAKRIEILEIPISKRKLKELEKKGITKEKVEKNLAEIVKIIGTEIEPIT